MYLCYYTIKQWFKRVVITSHLKFFSENWPCSRCQEVRFEFLLFAWHEIFFYSWNMVQNKGKRYKTPPKLSFLLKCEIQVFLIAPRRRGREEEWNVEQAPLHFLGVVVVSASYWYSKVEFYCNIRSRSWMVRLHTLFFVCLSSSYSIDCCHLHFCRTKWNGNTWIGLCFFG